MYNISGIDYYLADGSRIAYFLPTPGNLMMSDINAIIDQYFMYSPRELPEYMFINCRLWAIAQHNFIWHQITQDPNLGLCYVISTSAGPLKVKVLPPSSDAKPLLIGTLKDFERYNIDKLFDEIVLDNKDEQ